MCSSQSIRPLSSCLLSTACRIVPRSQARILCKRDHNHKSISADVDIGDKDPGAIKQRPFDREDPLHPL